MLQISELQQDRHFRWQLIGACLVVAILVSIIYVVVSYRLSADLGVRIELNSLEKQTLLLHAALIEADNQPEQRISELMHLIHLNEEDNAVFYISIHGPNFDWSMKQNMSVENIARLQESINRQQSMMSNVNGMETIKGDYLLWQFVTGEGYQIHFYSMANSIETTLNYIAKRLSITSIIVIWIAIWCALVLSFWMSKRVESKNNALLNLATHDQLTGLPNRLYLVDMMKKAIPSEPSHEAPLPDYQASLFVIDLDKFKEVNDTLGHTAGDKLLIEVSIRLLSILTREQTLVRTGGDEFLIWAPTLSKEQAEKLASNLVQVCEEPILINQLAINTGASIGVCHYPQHGVNTDTLIANADNAMYEAKQKHCGWMLFNEKEINNGHQRLRLRADLNDAFKQSQIKFYYQPKVDLISGEITGVEALARWFHPQEGLLSPIHFIDLIEQSGRVQEFGRYVIRSIIIQLSHWQAQGSSIPVAINLSPYNLLDPGLINFIKALLNKHQVSPRMLEIELTESATSLKIQSISHKFDELKRLGIPLAIDDFGTGMSSLSYISNLNVNIIKIDKSFIDQIETNEKHQAIVSSIITLAKSIGSNVVAEGIETKAQAALLKQMGCCYGQGYFFSRPISAKEMSRLLKISPLLPTD